MALAWATTKQLQVVVVVAAALFQRNNVVAFMIHPYRTTAGTCEPVPLHDPAPGCHPCATCNALGASRLCLQRGQSRGCDGSQPVRDALQLHWCLHVLPAIGHACALAAAVATLLMTAGQPQELQRTLPGARRISFADESVVKLWARYQQDKARCGVCSGPRTKKPHAANRAGLVSASFSGGSPCANRASPNADAD